MDVSTPAQYRDMVSARKTVIFASLSDGYLRVRVAVLRNWVQILIECEGQSPWRLHWPQSRDDDRIMTDFLVTMSMRYTTWLAVYTAKTHVLEFHRSFLAVVPPPMPMAEWMLAKLKRLMAQEKPEGRRIRPGLTDAKVSAICNKILASVTACVWSVAQRALYVNAGAAIGVAFEKALRMHEPCPGDDFSPEWHWSRASIAAALEVDQAVKAQGVEVFVLQPMKRKTQFASDAARERCTQPLVFGEWGAQCSVCAACGEWCARYERGGDAGWCPSLVCWWCI